MSRTRRPDSPRRPRTERGDLWTPAEIQAAYEAHQDREADINAWIEDEIDRQIEA